MTDRVPMPALLVAAVLGTAFPFPIRAESDPTAPVVLFRQATDEVHTYRIPGVAVTARGTVLVTCEARILSAADRGEIEIHLRRSTDGGRTWEPARQVAHAGHRLPRNPHMPASKRGKYLGEPDEQTVNNALLIPTRDGPVHLVYCVEYMRAFHSVSVDDGVTWSAPREITAAVDAFRPRIDWQAIAFGPGHGIETSSGRLVAPLWIADYRDGVPRSRNHAAAVLVSEDAGASWQAGGVALPAASEANIAELADGRLLLTARNSDARNERIAATSADGGTTWTDPHFIEDLPEHGCMAGLVRHPGTARHPGPLLLCSAIDTDDRSHQARRDLTVWLSRDDGATWPVSRRMHDGPSAYSDLAVLPDGGVVCVYESGLPGVGPQEGGDRPWAYACIAAVRFDLDWLCGTPPASETLPSAAITTPRIECFPREGRGYRLLDWRERTDKFLDVVLDPTRTGDYLPIMWWDDTRIHWPHTTFGLTSYVGMKDQWGVHRNAHEAIVTMGTLLSGALAGRDMARYRVPGSPEPVNLVAMQEAYFSPEDGVFLDGIGARSGQTFWYELFPSIVAGALVAEHPAETAFGAAWRKSCQRWAEAALHLWRLNDYDFQAYDLREKHAVVKQWREPDVAAGLAFLMQMAHAKWPEEQAFHHETRHALDWLCRQNRNVNYEIFPAFGVYAAARCNAEQGTDYDVAKLFGWCFEDSAVRGMSPHWPDSARGDGYGVVCGRWGDDDVAGLVGASRGALSKPSMRGGYAFAMETFAYAWPLVSAVRYDDRLARAVGKWMHAAAHSLRLAYPDQLPPERQTDWAWAERHSTAIPYEGVMERNNLTGDPGPFASGDPTNQGWGPLNLGVYSGAFSGIFGALIKPTNVPGVLALDTRRMDYFSTAAFPTLLLYNPGRETAHVTLPVGGAAVRAWDAVANTWIGATVADGTLDVDVAADDAVLAVLVPADLEPRFEHGRLVAGSTTVDWRVPTNAAP